VAALFEVRLNNQPRKVIKKTEEKLKLRIKSLFKVLENEPVPAREFDLKKISGTSETYRIRLGKHRIEYFVDWENKIIYILFIKRRKESTYK
jgi:mRNA-degrading endonuclease RelE of RelBE toxin-antitoxin system